MVTLPSFDFSEFEWQEQPLSAVQIAELWKRAHPDHPRQQLIVENEMNMRQPTDPFWQVSVWHNQQVIGFAETGLPIHEAHDGWLTSFILLDKQYANSTLATELLKQAEQHAKALGATTLMTKLHTNWWELELYKQHGYHEKDLTLINELDLTQFDLAAHISSLAKAQAAGVVLKPLSELGEFDEALQRRLYDLFFIALSDVPSNPPVAVWPFEDWQQRSAAEMKHKAGVWLALTPADEIVGLTEVHRPCEQKGRKGLLNGLTGVHPAWRSKGLAKALKVAAYRSAIEHGYQFIRTINHKRNPAILKINQSLGFKTKFNRVLIVKEVI